MSINTLLVFHHFRLPDESAGLRSYHILNSYIKFSQSNDKITVLIPSVDPLTGRKIESCKEYTIKSFPNNVEFIIIRCPKFDKNNIISRLFSYTIYTFNALISILLLRPFDIYLCSTYSLPILLLLKYVSKRNSSKFFVEIRDLFIHGFFYSLHNKIVLLIFYPLFRLLLYFESSALRSADLLFPNSPGFVKHIIDSYGVLPNKVKVVPLGCDSIISRQNSDFLCNPSSFQNISELKERVNSYRINFVYCGSLGKVHNPTPLIKLCRVLKNKRMSVGVHLFGRSRYHSALNDQFDFVYDYGLLTKQDIPQVIKLFDAGLYFSSEIFPFNAIMGNKYFDYINAGLPVIFLTKSYLMNICLKNRTGIFLIPNEFNHATLYHLETHILQSRSFVLELSQKYDSGDLCDVLVKYVLGTLRQSL